MTVRPADDPDRAQYLLQVDPAEGAGDDGLFERGATRGAHVSAQVGVFEGEAVVHEGDKRGGGEMMRGGQPGVCPSCVE